MKNLRWWPKYGLMIIWLILFGCLMSACAGISLKAPTTQALTKTAAFLAGYEIGKARPELAEEFIHYTQVDREDILVLYDSWKRYLAYRLGADPVHRKLIENMLELVEVDFGLKTTVEQEVLIQGLFTEFISGLETGLSSGGQ